MDVKNKNRIGYKKTKVGWIPDDWVEIAFGEVFEFIKTYAFSREQLTIAPQESVGIYNIHYGDIHATYDGYFLDFEKEGAVPLLKNATEIQSNLVLLQEGDLVITDVSEDYEGVCACVELKNIGSRKVTGGLHTFVARDKSGHSALGYRSCLLKHHAFAKRLKQISTGVSVHGVSKGNLSKEKIPLPPLPEQEAIARVLECWDKAIRNYEKKIEKKRKVKKGLMQRLLSGKQRLPGFSGEWEEVKLRTVAELIKDGTHGTHTDVSNGIPLLSAKDIIDGLVVVPHDSRRISEADFLAIHKNYYLKDGDILLSVVGTIGKVAMVQNYNRSYTFQRSVAIIRSNKKMLSEFVIHKFSSCEFQKELRRRENRGAQGGVYLGELAKIRWHQPSLQEQKAIASVLSAADIEIEAMERKLVILKDQKKFLLNNLVTGTIRLPKFRGRTKNTDTNGDHT